MRSLTCTLKEGALMVRRSPPSKTSETSRGSRRLAIVATLVVVAVSVAASASAQVAMLTQVAGDVKVSGKEGAREAVPFLKVNDGDTLALGANARVQLV